MRQLKITGQSGKPFHLDDVPAEYRFVESLARLFADNQEEIALLYQVGVEKAKQLRDVLSAGQYDRFAAWAVRQSIYQRKAENRGPTGLTGANPTQE